MIRKVTEDDWNMLDYFWNDKGDLTRWCDWEEFTKKPEAAPVVKAWNDYQTAQEMMEIVIQGIRP